jgi:hypothetical protein
VDSNNNALAATLGIFNGIEHTEKNVVNISRAQQKNKNNPVIIASTVSGSGNSGCLAQQLRGNFLIALAPYIPILL